MIKLEHYKEQIHKCSKCGFCQEVCPLYRQKGNECATARGLLILLRGVVLREVSLNKSSQKYLDACLRCGNCTQVCPSEIPFEQIVFAAKNKYLYSTLWGLFIRIAQSEFIGNLFKRRKKIVSERYDKKVVYLGKLSDEVVKILNSNGIEVLNTTELSWGVEYLLSGNLRMFRKNIRKIIAELISLKAESVITDIPGADFKNIIKIYANREFNLTVNYLGDYEEAESLVCKYYNPLYAKVFLENVKLTGNQ